MKTKEIGHIKIKEKITIKFKFEDEFKRCLEYIENNKKVLVKAV